MRRYFKFILVLIILITISGFVYFYFSRSTETQQVQNNDSDTNAKLETFINQSAVEMPGVRGSDALNSNTIASSSTRTSAEESASVTSSNEAVCKGNESESFKCYEEYYKDLVITKGLSTAFSDIKIRENDNQFVKAKCHPLAHTIGRTALSIYPEINDAFAHGDPYCWSGYYHGILEEFVDTMGKTEVFSKIDTICSAVDGKESYSFNYYNCVHGLGHGVMSVTNQKLFGALLLCDNLSGSWEKSSCYSGVFMENVIIENKGGTTDYLRPSEPIYPCNAVGDNYKQVCYLMQTSYMLKVSGNNFKTVFDICAQVESPYQATCYQSLGRDASGQSSSNKSQTKATCLLGANFEQKSNCVIGAVKDFISYYHSDIQAKEFCSSLTSDLGDVCLSTTESYYKSF